MTDTNTITKEQQRQEAIERLGILQEKGLHENVLAEFRADGTVSYSARTDLSPLGSNGILYWLNGNPDWERRVAEIEAELDILVYHATYEVLRDFGPVLDLFCVTKDEEEWEMDHDDLRDGYAFCYCMNLDHSEHSEFGTVSYQVAAGGGLIRNA